MDQSLVQGVRRYRAPLSKTDWRGYAVGMVSFAVALGLRWLLNPVLGDRQPYVTFFAAIAVTAMYGSLGGSVLVLALSLLATAFFFRPSDQGVEFQVGMLAYTFSAGLIILSGDLLRKSRRRTTAEFAARTQAEAAMRENEEQFRASFELAPVGKAQSDPHSGRFWRVNPMLCEITGYSAGDLLTKTEGEITHPEDRDDARLRFQQMAEGKTLLIKGEKRYLRPDGNIVWVEMMATMQRDAGGQPIRTLMVIQDVTARKEAERALALSRQRYRALISSLTSVVWRVSAEGQFTDIQLSWEAFTGQSWEQHKGVGWLQAVHPEDRERIQEAWIRARDSRSLFVAEGRLWYAPKGEYHYFEARAVPIFHPDGSVSEWIGCVTDTHERKLAELALAKAKSELLQRADELEERVAERTKALQETMGELEAFSYSISHDMRAPLRAMHQLSQILLEDQGPKLDAESRNYLERIRSSAQRLDKLIEDVLTYSRVGRTKSPPEKVEMDQLVRQILTEYPSLQAPVARVEIRGRLLPVLGQEASLTQCLTNLLGNAAKFTAKGTVPHIVVCTEAREGQVRLWVEDNGIGIAPRNQERIFNMFERIHGVKDYEGTGIGLAIVRKAVERMGGQIGLESDIGKGSKFWIQLPSG